MKRFALLACAALLAGCTDSAVVTDSDSSADKPETAQSTTENTAAVETSTPTEDTSAVTVSYDAGESATLSIPEMHCPFGCFPKAEDALTEVDGIASIELVKQKEEGVIDDRRVVVTFDGTVDSQAAIAALDSAGLPGASFEAGETSEN